MIQNLLSKWRNFTYGVKNIIKWMPVIYKDRNWDQWFIYEILKTKLEHQAEYMLHHGHLENSIKYAEEIHKCIEMINTVQNETIIDTELASINLQDDSQEVWEKLSEADRKQTQAKKDLFVYMEEHIEHWWD